MTIRASISRKPSFAGLEAMNSASPAVSRPRAAEVNALRAGTGMRAGIVGLDQNLGRAVARHDRDADIVAFGDAGLQRGVRSLGGDIERQIGSGRQFLSGSGKRSQDCSGENEVAEHLLVSFPS
jgi:hypothetical protein